MRTISKILHEINYIKIRVMNRLQPHSLGQLKAWVGVSQATDLSYIVNYFEQYLKHGIIWKNTLFRDRLVRERYNRESMVG